MQGRSTEVLTFTTMKYKSINLQEKFGLLTEQWAPRVVAEMNDYQFKVVKLEGDFVWHSHNETAETFLVLEGTLLLQTAHERVKLEPGQLYTVPAGLPHTTSPISERSVNLTIEKVGMSTERVDAPAESADTRP